MVRYGSVIQIRLPRLRRSYFFFTYFDNIFCDEHFGHTCGFACSKSVKFVGRVFCFLGMFWMKINGLSWIIDYYCGLWWWGKIYLCFPVKRVKARVSLRGMGIF